MTLQQVRHGERQVDLLARIQGLVDVQQSLFEEGAHPFPVDDRVGDEGQGPPSQGFLDQRRIDVKNAVSETLFGTSRAVMQFIGMQDVPFPDQAVPLFAAIAEGLDAPQRDADGVGVVAMRGKGWAGEIRRQAFDARAALPIVQARRGGAGGCR